MTRTSARSNWTWWLALPALLRGGTYFALGRTGGVPTGRVFDPATMLCDYAVLPFATIIVLVDSLALSLALRVGQDTFVTVTP